jgi:signal transduction histidine kinase
VPLRLRLALLNAIVLAGAILALGMLTYALEARSLLDDLDESLHTQAGNLTTVYQARATLPPRTRERVIPQPSVFSGPTFLVQVLGTDGSVLERSAALAGSTLPVKEQTLLRAGEGAEVFESVLLDRQQMRVFTTAMVSDEEFLGYLQVARPLQPPLDALATLRTTLLGAGAMLLVVSMFVAWLLAGYSLRPIGRITQAARAVALSGRLDSRLTPVATRDELARLVETFNAMMDRLEGAFTAQRRFVADASHELRTPLTTIRGNLELLRRSGAVRDPEMGDALEDVIGETERMARLVQGLLALARADAGQKLELQPIQLDELAHSVYREVQLLAGGVAIRLSRVDPVEVIGDADALKQLLLILAENGVKYTPPGGAVTLSVVYDQSDVVLSVQDTGPGIPPDVKPHIFERFYRAPTARSQGGTGLGLAIAQWIASEHGVQIVAESEPGSGTTFSVRMPGRLVTAPPEPRGAAAPELAPTA